MQKSGAQIVMESLIKEKTTYIFGYPGGSVIALYDCFKDYPVLHHILVRHEQGAAFAAEGYARASGKVGVCLATSGPGATNLVTGIANAYLDSVPVVYITGQVASNVMGSDAFQETDITGITFSITKHNYVVEKIEDLARIIKEAFHIARSGRPGPVLIDIPKDIFSQKTEYKYPKTVALPLNKSKLKKSDISKAVKLINSAKKPVIIAGHGIMIGGAENELRAFAEKTNMPVVLTVLGLGALDEAHELCMGMLGMHGHAAANYAVHNADLIIGIGERFDDRITGQIDELTKNTKIIHIEIDEAEINKNVRVDVPLIGDCKLVIPELIKGCSKKKNVNWLREIDSYSKNAKKTLLKIYPIKRAGKERPFTYDVVREIRKVSGPDAIIVTDVGQHQMFTCQSYEFAKPNKLITSGGLGSMGFGLPAALGAKVACPEDEVWLINGDGGIQMNIQELMTLVQENINIKIAIIQNSYLGMVRQWQEFFYNKNYASTPLLSPNYKYIAKGFGVKYLSAKRVDEIAPAVRKMNEHEGSCICEFYVKKEEKVLPMVPSGKTLGDMIISID